MAFRSSLIDDISPFYIFPRVVSLISDIFCIEWKIRDVMTSHTEYFEGGNYSALALLSVFEIPDSSERLGQSVYVTNEIFSDTGIPTPGLCILHVFFNIHM